MRDLTDLCSSQPQHNRGACALAFIYLTDEVQGARLAREQVFNQDEDQWLGLEGWKREEQRISE